jgi:hypothetical protein
MQILKQFFFVFFVLYSQILAQVSVNPKSRIQL